MIEVTGNLWDYPADFVIITTNGTIKTNGEAVMGRGCAKEAKDRFPTISRSLGGLLRVYGNHPLVTPEGPITLPVKHNWWEKADIELIRQSAYELREFADDMLEVFTPESIEKVRGRTGDKITYVMPRPGCGNGGLRWEDVKPVIAPLLDDRFHVITFGGPT